MGKGDKKSKKGKIFKGSFGNSRKRKVEKAEVKSDATPTPVATSKKKTS
ncbi:30S ribosomal protein THX [Sporocytophaga myxococcoides]|nr:30S ribosomal protein THX [Sporocytophaga myxococcoides]